jgi:hypothetical protein
MLACLVHKDNKDVSCHPKKLPPGRSCKDLQKGKERAISEERAKAKADHPIPIQETYGDVDCAIKKAKMEGMNAY